MLLAHWERRADSRAAWMPGSKNAIRMLMIATTTNSSTSVKPRRIFPLLISHLLCLETRYQRIHRELTSRLLRRDAKIAPGSRSTNHGWGVLRAAGRGVSRASLSTGNRFAARRENGRGNAASAWGNRPTLRPDFVVGFPPLFDLHAVSSSCKSAGRLPGARLAPVWRPSGAAWDCGRFPERSDYCDARESLMWAQRISGQLRVRKVLSKLHRLLTLCTSRPHIERDNDTFKRRRRPCAAVRDHARPLDRRIVMEMTMQDRLGRAQRPGVTLVELLTVVAIISLLMAMLMPALTGPENRAAASTASTICGSSASACKATPSGTPAPFVGSLRLAAGRLCHRDGLGCRPGALGNS